MTSGWYYLNSNVTVDDRIFLTGNTWLIQGDNCTLDIKGLYIPKGSTLRIYAQSEGDNAGKLISKPNGGGAGIGATRDNHPGGGIVIHGGNIEAKGDDHCAGFGSNDGNGTTSPITIYGGTINAKGGSDGAGIGGGDSGDGGMIHIFGGNITVNEDPNEDGAGIGGSGYWGAGVITINGGIVNAYGTACAPAIGTGSGGDTNSKGGSITITGGTVNATGRSNFAAAVGGGYMGGGVDININGGNVTVNSGTVGIGYGLNGSGNPCKTTLSWTDDSRDTLSVACSSYNGSVTLEGNFKDLNSDKVFLSGKADTLSSLAKKTLVPIDGYVIKYLAGYDAPGETMKYEVIESGQWYKLSECTFEVPEDVVFEGWISEDGRLCQENEEAEITGDCTFTAQWKLKYDLTVGGTKVTPENKNDILNDGGTAVFIPKTNTLILNGEFDGKGLEGNAYIAAQDMNLKVKGEADIIVDEDSDMDSSVYVENGSLTLSGDFRMIGKDKTIFAGGITVESGSLYAEAIDEKGIPITSFNGNLTITEDVERFELVSSFSPMSAMEYFISDQLYVEAPVNGSISDGIVYDADGSPVTAFVLAQKPLTEPVFKGHQLVLSGSLGLKFGVKFPEGTDGSDSYVTFTVSGQEQTAQPEDGGDRKIYTCYLNTLQMAEEITAVLHSGDDQTVTATYSLVDYFNYFDEHEDDYSEKTLTLVHAVANYGYFAYPYLVQLHGLKGKYAFISKYYPTSFDIEEIKQKVAQYTFAKGINDSAVSAASYKLSLDSDTALSVMVKVPAGTEVSASAEFNGQTYEMTKDSDTVWSVKIPGIKASQLGDTIMVSGTAGGDFTISVSALSYVRSVLNSDKYKGDAQNAVMALFKSYEAVTGY